MKSSLRLWNRRLAMPMCALVATSGLAAWASESSPPQPLTVNGAAALVAPADHVHTDDPPPAPPVNFAAPSTRNGRGTPTTTWAPRANTGVPTTDPKALRAETPSSTAPADAPLTFNVPDNTTPAVTPDIAPIPAPVEKQGDPSLAPGNLIAPDPVEDVRITAPIPADVPETEMVQERYDNGSLKIAREVTQDANGNFVNHGSWKQWSQQGELIAEGHYQNGVRDGIWRRVLQAKESPLFATPPYDQYHGPFISEARFEKGNLAGAWVISDAKGHKVSEIPFEGGVRSGVATWYHANGRKMQQITFAKGVATGEILTWRTDGSLAAKEVYLDGQKVESKTEQYPQKQQKSLGEYLAPRQVVSKPDDWWNARLATFTAEGTPERHGKWTAWHQNGQVQVEGKFDHGHPVGEFTWYYANGQKSVEGSYQSGERHGVWTWWHENGLKASSGEFVEGKPAGHWTWWTEDGKVAQKADFADGVPQQALEDVRRANQAAIPSAQRRRK
jgi:antitoxin component YwqK of YwqJK toxin-antitoxin module